jgi:hypothetical protein
MLWLAIIVILSFVLMHAIEITSFGARIAGRISNRVALGTTLAQTLYTASRFLLVLFLPSLGFLVESGIDINQYILLVLITYFLSSLVTAILILNLNKVQIFFQAVFIRYEKHSIPISIIKSLTVKNKDSHIKAFDKFSFQKIVFKKTLVSFGAYLFLITGFFSAFMLAVLYPDYRLTLSQLTAIFHGFGSIIFAFYLDPMLSRSIDAFKNKTAWIENVYSILLGRFLSYLFVFILLILLPLLLKYWL